MLAKDKLTEFPSKIALEVAATSWIHERLQDAIDRRRRAVLMAAGGSTPANIYARLSEERLDWSSIQVGLTDERWVDNTHAASNTAMLHRTLLQGSAAQAAFLPMKTSHEDVFDAVEAVDSIYQPARCSDVMILGMGPDSHTLSWFQGGRGYDSAVSADNPSTVAAIIAPQSEVTGPNTVRMTLTQTCVANARHVLLLITGKDKRQVFETAPNDAPVSIMTKAAGDALSVLYCD